MGCPRDHMFAQSYEARTVERPSVNSGENGVEVLAEVALPRQSRLIRQRITNHHGRQLSLRLVSLHPG